ncbi:MAG: hypothetical protein U5K75_09195 [Ahrensia sp.]|nr:hypothetical protein [Ahrensia sp.]
MKKTLALMTVLSAIAATPAFAADVEFNGTVATSCTLVAAPGSLTQNANATVLASGTAGEGTVTVTTNSNNFGVTLGNASWTSTPSAYSGTTTFVTTGQIGSATAVASGTAMPVVDTNVIKVNVTATKDGGGSFQDGAYTALVVATCS